MAVGVDQPGNEDDFAKIHDLFAGLHITVPPAADPSNAIGIDGQCRILDEGVALIKGEQ